MIFFNWRKICLAARNNTGKALKIFYYISHNVDIKSHRDAMYSIMKGWDFSGNSFILNPKPLFAGRYTPKELIEYISMASLRSYANYRITGEVGLSLLHCPLQEETIDENRLLYIKDDKVMFIYEERNN